MLCPVEIMVVGSGQLRQLVHVPSGENSAQSILLFGVNVGVYGRSRQVP